MNMGERALERTVALSPAFPLVERTHQGVWSISFHLCLAFAIRRLCVGRIVTKQANRFIIRLIRSRWVFRSLYTFCVCVFVSCKVIVIIIKEKDDIVLCTRYSRCQNSNKQKYVSFALKVCCTERTVMCGYAMWPNERHTWAFGSIFLMSFSSSNFYFSISSTFLVEGLIRPLFVCILLSILRAHIDLALLMAMPNHCDHAEFAHWNGYVQIV